jgi:4-hydroxybenzoate polyprenyltransferase
VGCFLPADAETFMSKIDRLKEEIGWLKVAFGVAVALDASLVAWLAQNYEKAPFAVVVAAGIGVVALAVAVVIINRRAYSRIMELEDV